MLAGHAARGCTGFVRAALATREWQSERRDYTDESGALKTLSSVWLGTLQTPRLVELEERMLHLELGINRCPRIASRRSE